jgi:hypothetical protein
MWSTIQTEIYHGFIRYLTGMLVENLNHVRFLPHSFKFTTYRHFYPMLYNLGDQSQVTLLEYMSENLNDSEKKILRTKEFIKFYFVTIRLKKSYTWSMSKDTMWILSYIAGLPMKTCYRTNLHKLLSLYYPQVYTQRHFKSTHIKSTHKESTQNHVTVFLDVWRVNWQVKVTEEIKTFGELNS